MDVRRRSAASSSDELDRLAIPFGCADDQVSVVGPSKVGMDAIPFGCADDQVSVV